MVINKQDKIGRHQTNAATLRRETQYRLVINLIVPNQVFTQRLFVFVALTDCERHKPLVVVQLEFNWKLRTDQQCLVQVCGVQAAGHGSSHQWRSAALLKGTGSLNPLHIFHNRI